MGYRDSKCDSCNEHLDNWQWDTLLNGYVIGRKAALE